MPPAQLPPNSTRSPYDPPHPPKRVFLEMITDSAEMAAAAAGVTAATRWDSTLFSWHEYFWAISPNGGLEVSIICFFYWFITPEMFCLILKYKSCVRCCCCCCCCGEQFAGSFHLRTTLYVLYFGFIYYLQGGIRRLDPQLSSSFLLLDYEFTSGWDPTENSFQFFFSCALSTQMGKFNVYSAGLWTKSVLVFVYCQVRRVPDPSHEQLLRGLGPGGGLGKDASLWLRDCPLGQNRFWNLICFAFLH